MIGSFENWGVKLFTGNFNNMYIELFLILSISDLFSTDIKLLPNCNETDSLWQRY